MAKQTFALERGGPKRLEIAWSGMFKNVQVTLDGAPIGSFETKKQLEEGGNFGLPDGSQLHVQLKRQGMATELQLRRNGEPLPGSASDPQQRVATAAGMLYFIAALNAALGIVAELGVEFLARIGVGWGNVVAALIYAGLGYLVKAKQSRVALVLAIVLFVLDGIASVFAGTHAGGSPPVGGLVARIFLLIPLWSGVPALTALNKAKAAQPA
jgi:hypothetical protein